MHGVLCDAPRLTLGRNDVYKVKITSGPRRPGNKGVDKALKGRRRGKKGSVVNEVKGERTRWTRAGEI